MAVFGKTEVGASSRSLPIGYSVACRYLCPENGIATEIVAYVQGRWESGVAKAKLYQDINGQVGPLLTESPEIILTQVGEHRFTISYPVVGGTYYWIAVHPSVIMLYWHDLGYLNQSSNSWGHTYPLNPDPWDSDYGPNYSDLEVSFYCGYTPTLPPPQYILGITSNPISGISFRIRDEGEMVTPWSGSLEEGTYEVEMPSNVLVGSDTYNFVQWEDGSTNPLRTYNHIGEGSLNAEFQLQIVTALEIHAFKDSEEVVANGLIVETDYMFQTPIIIEVVPSSYTIRLTYEGITKEYIANPIEGETIRIDGQMIADKLPIVPLLLVASVGIILIYRFMK